MPIVMSFDRIAFDGGLGVCGVKQSFLFTLIKRVWLMRLATCISAYKDLNHLLGVNWHVRGIEIFVMFYWIYKYDYYIYHAPNLDDSIMEVSGYVLVFLL